MFIRLKIVVLRRETQSNENAVVFYVTQEYIYIYIYTHREDSIKRPGAYLIFIIFLHPL